MPQERGLRQYWSEQRRTALAKLRDLSLRADNAPEQDFTQEYTALSEQIDALDVGCSLFAPPEADYPFPFYTPSELQGFCVDWYRIDTDPRSPALGCEVAEKQLQESIQHVLSSVVASRRGDRLRPLPEAGSAGLGRWLGNLRKESVGTLRLRYSMPAFFWCVIDGLLRERFEHFADAAHLTLQLMTVEPRVSSRDPLTQTRVRWLAVLFDAIENKHPIRNTGDPKSYRVEYFVEGQHRLLDLKLTDLSDGKTQLHVMYDKQGNFRLCKENEPRPAPDAPVVLRAADVQRDLREAQRAAAAQAAEVARQLVAAEDEGSDVEIVAKASATLSTADGATAAAAKKDDDSTDDEPAEDLEVPSADAAPTKQKQRKKARTKPRKGGSLRPPTIVLRGMPDDVLVHFKNFNDRHTDVFFMKLCAPDSEVSPAAKQRLRQQGCFAMRQFQRRLLGIKKDPPPPPGHKSMQRTRAGKLADIWYEVRWERAKKRGSLAAWELAFLDWQVAETQRQIEEEAEVRRTMPRYGARMPEWMMTWLEANVWNVEEKSSKLHTFAQRQKLQLELAETAEKLYRDRHLEEGDQTRAKINFLEQHMSDDMYLFYLQIVWLREKAEAAVPPERIVQPPTAAMDDAAAALEAERLAAEATREFRLPSAAQPVLPRIEVVYDVPHKPRAYVDPRGVVVLETQSALSEADDLTAEALARRAMEADALRAAGPPRPPHPNPFAGAFPSEQKLDALYLRSLRNLAELLHQEGVYGVDEPGRARDFNWWRAHVIVACESRAAAERPETAATPKLLPPLKKTRVLTDDQLRKRELRLKLIAYKRAKALSKLKDSIQGAQKEEEDEEEPDRGMVFEEKKLDDTALSKIRGLVFEKKKEKQDRVVPAILEAHDADVPAVPDAAAPAAAAGGDAPMDKKDLIPRRWRYRYSDMKRFYSDPEATNWKEDNRATRHAEKEANKYRGNGRITYWGKNEYGQSVRKTFNINKEQEEDDEAFLEEEGDNNLEDDEEDARHVQGRIGRDAM